MTRCRLGWIGLAALILGGIALATVQIARRSSPHVTLMRVGGDTNACTCTQRIEP
jgi:hypothetical protein